MTDEQIKQNAEAYTAENYITGIPAITNAYIAGAHSRDEEIEQLGKSYHDMFCVLANKVEQLRKPWISVEERLPGKSRGLYRLEEDEQHKHVLFRTRNGLTFSGYLDAEEIWRDERTLPVNFITPSPVTHWMQIPELPKTEK